MDLLRSVGIRVLIAAALFLPALEPALLAQKRKQLRETVTVTVVEVPVQVTVKGQPLRSLTRDDFEILDGRKKREIIGFERVDLSEAQEVNADVPVAARRHFLALFDLSYSDPFAVDRATKAASEVVLSALHPTDMVAVATFSHSRGLQLVIGFTTDRNQVRQAIETLGLVAPRSPVVDPLGLVIGDLDSGATGIDSSTTGIDSGTGAGAVARIDVQAELRETLDSTATLRGRAQRGEQGTRVARVMEALGQVAELMGSVQGRKHVLYLSEGFASEMLFGTENMAEIEEQSLAVLEGRTQDVDSDLRFGDSSVRRVVDRALETFRRADCTIQAIDLARGTGGRKNPNIDSLRYMANQTGGKAYANFNNLGEAMGRMLAETSVTYLLAFQPGDLEYDGEFHKLRVRLTNAPRGAKVTHRPGYYAAKPFEQRNGSERRLATGQRVIGSRAGGDVAADVLAAAFTVADGRTYVPILIEVDGPSLLRNDTGDVAAVEIYAYALDEEGAVRGFFTRQLGLDKKAAGMALQQNGLKYWGHLDLTPGEYTVRVLVRNSATGLTGVQIATVTVPPGDGNEALLLPPLFREPPGKWTLIREEPSEQRAGIDYPFLSQGQPFIPAARPIVSPRTEAPLSLMSYNLGEGPLRVTGQLLSATGERVEDWEIDLEEGASGSSGRAEVPATFKLGQVAPGDYTLVVTLENPGTGREDSSTISIRVSG